VFQIRCKKLLFQGGVEFPTGGDEQSPRRAFSCFDAHRSYKPASRKADPARRVPASQSGADGTVRKKGTNMNKPEEKSVVSVRASEPSAPRQDVGSDFKVASAHASEPRLRPRTARLAKMGLMTAIAVICSLIHFPILPGATFLEFEVSDIPILIAAFAFGPIPGLIVAAVSILLHDVLIGMANGPYGMIMHMIAIGMYVLVSGLIYKRFKSRRGALTGLILGGLCMVFIMIPANILITPHFMVTSVEFVYGIIPTVILPFNLIKFAINAVVVFLLYKRLSPFLHKM
jgi:riboflavin transporter FmnP